MSVDSSRERLRIGISIDSVHRTGGTQRSTWEIAERLGHIHDVTLITKQSDALGTESFRCHVLDSKWVRLPYLGNLIFAWKVSRLKAKFNLDILNVQGSNGIYQDVITAQSVHKKWFRWSLGQTPVFSWPWWRKIFNPIHYIVIFLETIQYRSRMHRRVIAISHQVKGDLIDHYGVDAKSIDVVHHGVNICEFSPDLLDDSRSSIRAGLGIDANAIVVIFVAHEFKRKGLKILLESLGQTPEKYCLLVIGKDDPSEFKTLATALGIAHRVKFVGPQKLLGPWYRAADVFAFPTSYEAFGMVITEALAAGIPVVVPREAGAAELIEHGKGGYLMDRWDDVNQLTGFLRKLEDDALRAAMGKMARLTAESRTWDDAANETLAVYYRVLKR